MRQLFQKMFPFRFFFFMESFFYPFQRDHNHQKILDF